MLQELFTMREKKVNRAFAELEMGARDHGISAIMVVLAFCLYPTQFCVAVALSNITCTQPLMPGQTLVSPNRVFELGFFSTANSFKRYVGIWYRGMSPQSVVWVANRDSPLEVSDLQSSLAIARNGNLEVFDQYNSSVWSTGAEVPSRNSVVLLTDSGNLILKDISSGDILWQGFHHPCDTALPGLALGFNQKDGSSYTLSSWKTDSDPSLGDFTYQITQETPPQAKIFQNGSTPHWRSGPWSRLKFVGVPEMDGFYQSPFDIARDEDKGTTYVTFTSFSPMLLQYLYLSSNGEARYLWKEASKDHWNMSWKAPANFCDFYGACGPFAICNIKERPFCKCLPGFVPSSANQWIRGDWSGGCTRRTNLLEYRENTTEAQKQNETDGFLRIPMIKLPDLHEYFYVTFPQDCEKWCLVNGSCVAYAFVKGIGCLLWSRSLIDIQQFNFGGEDLYLRLAHIELVERTPRERNIGGILAVLGFAMACLTIVISLRIRGKIIRGKIEETKHICPWRNLPEGLKFGKDHSVPELPLLSFQCILFATKNFDPTNKLGQGGFGPVYKGKLQDGTEIAVKRLSSSSGQGMVEFQNEMVLISKLQHRNLVRLMGYCVAKDEKILVYEFMRNKSLDLFIFDQRRKAQLDWVTRFDIIIGVSRGILYLHRDSHLRVIHRDLKVGNILLDEKMNPKISDFGLARMFEGTIDLGNTRRVVGTLGYMAPEYAMRGIFSEKSDVFSFGVLILEIVSGKKNTSIIYCDEQQSLIAKAWQLWNERKIEEFVDKALSDSYSMIEAQRCVHVGLLCVQDYAIDRPTMPDVISMLAHEREPPSPRQPVFDFHSSPKRDSQRMQSGSTGCIQGASPRRDSYVHSVSTSSTKEFSERRDIQLQSGSGFPKRCVPEQTERS